MARQAYQRKKEKGILSIPEPATRQTISSRVKNLVKDFCQSDDISRMCPGKKDCVTVRTNGGDKLKMQMRLLLANLKEIYSMFQKENHEVKVGFSSFASLFVPNGVSWQGHLVPTLYVFVPTTKILN